jgi:osmotically inducible protein OsmC
MPSQGCLFYGPVRKEQIVPALRHDPAACRQWPWPVGDLFQVCAHEKPMPLLDTIVTSIYPSLSLVNRILGIRISQTLQTAQKECIMQRKASAVWQGGLKDGKGSISTDSGVLKQTQYSFSTRFENGVGTNPEELLAAAHAGCFTMALSAQLGGAGMTAQKLETTATISLDKVGDGFAITKSHLDLVATIPGADKAKFDAAVKAAETGCPVSKLFKAEISVTARLNS